MPITEKRYIVEVLVCEYHTDETWVAQGTIVAEELTEQEVQRLKEKLLRAGSVELTELRGTLTDA